MNRAESRTNRIDLQTHVFEHLKAISLYFSQKISRLDRIVKASVIA